MRFFAVFLLTASACSNEPAMRTDEPLAQKACHSAACRQDDTSRYWSLPERAKRALTIKDGLFFDANGTPADGPGIYVLSPDSTFYFDPQPTPAQTSSHSFFLAGKPVLCGGWLIFDHGKLTYIDNASGHYRPNSKFLLQTLRVLSRNSVDLSHVEILTL